MMEYTCYVAKQLGAELYYFTEMKCLTIVSSLENLATKQFVTFF